MGRASHQDRVMERGREEKKETVERGKCSGERGWNKRGRGRKGSGEGRRTLMLRHGSPCLT